MTKAKSKMAPQKIDNDFESNKDSVKANPKDAIERARNNLAKAKLMEAEKKDHVWISKEKTTKLIHISKLQSYLNDNWKCNTKK